MRLRFPCASLIALASLLAACAESEDPGVDRIFVNAAAYTLVDDAPWAEAVAVDGGRIVYVGDNDGAQALAGDETITHDLDGKMLLPGFIDTHTHPVSGGAFAKALSLDTFGTVQDWIHAIAKYAEDNPDAPLIFGYGFLASTFGPTGPTRQMLDSVVPARSVLIMDEGFHGAWANTRTLEALNITQDTPDPVPGFSYYKRDANGDATGYLLEGTAGQAMRDLDVITEEVIVDGTARELGVRLTFGSDFPASGAGMLGMSPVVQMEIGHTRQAAGNPGAPVQPRTTERFDLDSLIRGYTIDAAYQLRLEDEIGSLEPGKKADLVVLDGNLFETDTYAIHETGVVMTLLDGEIVYQSNGS